MAAVRGDLEPVAGAETPRLSLILEAQMRRTSHQQYPFGLALVVPQTRRARLAMRHDPLDPQPGTGRERLGYLRGARVPR
jgi:hypothetical protein